jgi:hypothetical protein
MCKNISCLVDDSGHSDHWSTIKMFKLIDLFIDWRVSGASKSILATIKSPIDAVKFSNFHGINSTVEIAWDFFLEF